jgi:hypothetical protein
MLIDWEYVQYRKQKKHIFQNYNELFQWYLSYSYSDVQPTSGEGNKQAGIKQL